MRRRRRAGTVGAGRGPGRPAGSGSDGKRGFVPAGAGDAGLDDPLPQAFPGAASPALPAAGRKGAKVLSMETALPPPLEKLLPPPPGSCATRPGQIRTGTLEFTYSGDLWREVGGKGRLRIP